MSEPVIYHGIALPELGDGELVMDGIFLLKVLDTDGQVKYREFKTPTLHAVEALGMVDTMEDTLRSALMRGARKLGE